MELLSKSDWESLRREPYQKFKDYEYTIKQALESTLTIAERLNDKDFLKDKPKGAVYLSSNHFFEASLELEFFSYSAGVPVNVLSEYFPNVIYALKKLEFFHLDFHKSGESDGHLVPHLELVTSEYWEALQLVCFSILFAQPEHVPTIMDILAYENDEQDALLDKLVSPWLPERDISNIYLRQLPYRKLDKVFSAKEEDRPKLMSQYLDEWYGASKREPYHDRHKSSQFPGYWSLEAAAVTVVLRIDDSSYRDKPYYPKDLVDYARSQYTPLDQQGNAEDGDKRLRCFAGEICPQSGEWYSPANNMDKRHFNQGDVMPEIPNNAWGETIWYLDLSH